MEKVRTIIQRNQHRGFTLVESLTVVFIMILLASLLLASGRAPTRTHELNRAAQTLMAELRRAQSLAITAHEGNCGQTVPYFIFQTEIDASQNAFLEVFADCNRNDSVDGSDMLIKSTELENVYVDNISPASGGEIEVSYRPPEPIVRVNGGQQNTFHIFLCHRNDTSLCLEVAGNEVGNIQIN